MTPLLIISFYLVLLLCLAWFSKRLFRGTAADYFLASYSIGPFLLLMSVFGTTMTAFALVGSTGEAYRGGIAVYGTLASWSGLVHAAVFFFVGMRLWALGKRYGYMTQIQYFRDRFESPGLGTLLFPVLVALVIPYLLIGLLGATSVVQSLTRGAFPETFAATSGGVPPWLSGLVISGVVLVYIFFGGLRGAALANAFQTMVFMFLGVVAVWAIADALGGPAAATQRVLELHPERLVREGSISHWKFIAYALVPLSVGMFPHVFQHWLTARSAKTFRLTVAAHPVCILLVWLPCVMIGVWATSATMPDGTLIVPPDAPPNTELARMVDRLTAPALTGLLGAGILAAIMSSLDSQFLALGTMFTNDIVVHRFGHARFSDRQRVTMARGFIIAIVGITYLLSLAEPRQVFPLGVWCFSGFTGLFPLVVAALYWKRVTRAGAAASVMVMAVVWFVLFRASGYGAQPDYVFGGAMPIVTIFAASLLTLVGISLVTRPPSAATLKKFNPNW
ncbi:MAG TPA: sodium:solute symporter family protein [Candidatus Acidoferrales bacterium]